jgi:hypothetical protein
LVGLSETEVNKIISELSNMYRYPSDAEEVQRGLKMVEPVFAPQCIYDKGVVQKSANKGALIGFAKGIGKVLGELSLAVAKKKPVRVVAILGQVSKEISKQGSKGYMTGFTKGNQEALNELHQCQSVAVKSAAEKIITQLYLYPQQQKKAI